MLVSIYFVCVRDCIPHLAFCGDLFYAAWPVSVVIWSIRRHVKLWMILKSIEHGLCMYLIYAQWVVIYRVCYKKAVVIILWTKNDLNVFESRAVMNRLTRFSLLSNEVKHFPVLEKPLMLGSFSPAIPLVGVLMITQVWYAELTRDNCTEEDTGKCLSSFIMLPVVLQGKLHRKRNDTRQCWWRVGSVEGLQSMFQDLRRRSFLYRETLW